MPLLTIKDAGTFDIDDGVRLVNAIESCGVDIGHRCGGQAKCTTCRVRFAKGEPEEMTRAEYEKLESTDQLGDFRLACQLAADRPMTVEVLMRASEMGWDDPGPAPAAEVEPEAAWFSTEALERE